MSYLFGSNYEFLLDLDKRILFKNANLSQSSEREAICLTNRQWDFLTYLVKKAGKLVTKQDLIENVWANACVVDAAIANVLGEVRKKIGDKPKNSLFIQTHSGVGYRFIAQVKHQSEQNCADADIFNSAYDAADLDLHISDLKKLVTVFRQAVISSDQRQDIRNVIMDLATVVDRVA